MTDGVCLDTGALIAIERGDRRVLRLLELVAADGGEVAVTAGVIAQAWRGGPRQARLARLLGADGVTLVDLDAATARAVGVVCAASGTTDVVDAHVALHARRRSLVVVTSDPTDVALCDPGVRVIAL